jgi:pimeloyl-ACP methyl ester carboxylesterase
MSRFRSFDGTEIFYQQWGAASASPPVVLHHGFVADANLNWVATGIVGALTATGRRVIAPDARGHGQSAKPHDPALYGEHRMARDLRCLLDELELAEVDLVGYSMGAIVALLAAVQESRVRRLVLGGIGAAVVELGRLDTRNLPNLLLAEALTVENTAAISHPSLAAFRAFADAIHADRQALAAHAVAANIEAIPLEQIRVPTLVLAGESDPLAQRPQVLQAAIAGAQLRVLPGDHFSVLTQPGFRAALVEFLS